ncbi:MAG: amino acid adenylation domain-containing protein [Anaerolineales bacterium]|nr:amino acid adenylation domain-containing protein [Anaerolineales bacterium]
MTIQQSQSVSQKFQNLNRLPHIQESVEDCAWTAPDSIAVEYRNERITYRELNHRANQQAHYLRGLGVGPETLVGICAHRSIDTIVGILGIIKAGGAYIPLDPNYPRSRLKFILEDANAQVVVTQSVLADLFSDSGAKSVHLDRDWETVNRYPSDDLQPEVSPENLVYVIYTSGSTGKPKGVMITHSNLSNFVRNVASALDVNPSDRYLQSASISYALSVRQMMAPLSLGATLVLATAEQMQDPLALFELIRRRGVTLMDMVPSFWRTCIQRLSDLPEGDREALFENRLRRIVSVGEPLYSDVPLDWRRQFSHAAQLVNIFGQTETTGVVATFPIPQDFRSERPVVVPVGTAVPNTKIYILDADLREVRAGETGELCVSSACLARGYLNHPDLTAEKFIANPFDDGLSDRLYRTGDLALSREDGNIEFIGRRDSQVKIRGQRLEIREVESVLREIPEVANCVVVALGEKPEDKYLAAYVVSKTRVSADSIRTYMRERLPDYMTPARIVFLDALPLTPNGKIDRLALPAPETYPEADSGRRFAEADNETEKRTLMLWRDLLKTGSFGIHDNFFDIGGDSLLAVRLFGRIEREFGIRLPITTLYQAATVAQLSALIENRDGAPEPWSPVVPVQLGSGKPPLFGIHGHEGGVLFWHDVVRHLPVDQPFFAIQAQGVDGLSPALTRIEDMAELYVRELRKTQSHGPYYFVGFSMGGEIGFEMSRSLHLQGEEVRLLVMLDTRNPNRAARGIVNEVADLSAADSRRAGSLLLTKSKTKLDWHIRNISGLSFGEKLHYAVHLIVHNLDFALLTQMSKAYRFFGVRMPDPLLLRYLRKSHTRAISQYVPLQYPGKIVMFRSSVSLSSNPDDASEGWRFLAGGGVETFHFKATHNIVDAEYAEEVALKLDECLVKARGF